MLYTSKKILVFSANKSFFAFNLEDVQEITANLSISPILRNDHRKIGISVLRGKTLTIVNSNDFFSVQKGDSEPSFFIVLNNEFGAIGIAVDAIHSILDITTSSLLETPFNMKKTCVNNFFISGDDIINVINAKEFVLRAVGHDDESHNQITNKTANKAA